MGTYRRSYRIMIMLSSPSGLFSPRGHNVIILLKVFRSMLEMHVPHDCHEGPPISQSFGGNGGFNLGSAICLAHNEYYSCGSFNESKHECSRSRPGWYMVHGVFCNYAMPMLGQSIQTGQSRFPCRDGLVWETV